MDRQKHQPRHVVLWSETRGMVEQIERVASEYSIRVHSSGGFDGVGPKHDFGREVAGERDPVILHIGDYDPSGEAMYSCLSEDVTAFATHFGAAPEFIRLAVTRRVRPAHGPAEGDRPQQVEWRRDNPS